MTTLSESDHDWNTHIPPEGFRVRSALLPENDWQGRLIYRPRKPDGSGGVLIYYSLLRMPRVVLRRRMSPLTTNAVANCTASSKRRSVCMVLLLSLKAAHYNSSL